MVVTLGILLIGGHFLAAASIALLVSVYLPDWGVVVFLICSIWFGAAVLRLQTRLERFFIRKHVAKKPRSWWNVIDTSPEIRNEGAVDVSMDLPKQKPTPNAIVRLVARAAKAFRKVL